LVPVTAFRRMFAGAIAPTAVAVAVAVAA